jgi:type III secretory pathway component EscR
MKKLLIIVTLFILSVVTTYGQSQKVMQQSNKPPVDTLKRPMTDEEKKYQEYLQWQQKTNQVSRSVQNDKNLETIDQQATTLDSLIIQQPTKKASAPKKK